MIITKKNINTILKAAIAAVPAIPYVMKSRRRSSNVTAYVLGGVGFALAGGIAALMFFSPRTRTRALTAAKDTLNTVNDKISHIREDVGVKLTGKSDDVSSMANGFSSHDSDDYGTTTTGL